MNDFERYYEAVAYLDGLANLPESDDYMSGRTKPAVFIKRTREFLDALGNPEKKFKYIHIAGTAGKGTVTTMVHDALAASSERVGSFMSPYVTAAVEKIRVGNLYIAPGEFADIVEQLKPYIDSMHFNGKHGRPSYFEIYFAIALLYFKRKKCTWVVLEVGAGGRYDATNVITNPVATAITSIDYDHVQILGKTLLSIADNKAGIIKKGSAFFTTEKRPALLKMFLRICKGEGAKFNSIAPVEDYQENNKALARAICRYIGISEAIAEKAIQKTKLPCRFELVGKKPLIVLDGAHNRAKMRSTIRNLARLSYKQLHLVIAIGARKDASVMLREIVPFAHCVYVTRFQNTNVPCADPKVLGEEVQKHLKASARRNLFLDPYDAFAAARSAAAPKDLVLVTGSFYLAGELRTLWYPEEWVLENRKSF